MKKILKNTGWIIIFMLVILGIMTIKANAASLSITTSKSSIAPGGSFTATVTVSGGAGQVSISVQNGSGSTTQWIDNTSYTFTCVAGSSGTVKISTSGTIGDYTTEQDEAKSASKSVSIVTPTTPPSSGSNNNSSTTTPTVTKSSDATLSAITVEGYDLAPEFNKSTTEYSLTVPNEITSLNIFATVNNSKANYSISELPELQVGQNIYTITVTAENGTTKTYGITVIRERAKLNLSILTISSVNKNGVVSEMELEPIFNSTVYTYKLKDLSYEIEKLNVVATSNLEGTIIEIAGNENLSVGENIITITATFREEGKEDEIIKYEITVNKEAEPVIVPLTKWQQIQKLFKDIGNNIFSWYTKNQSKFTASLLIGCSTALLGLTIYFVIDYKKYKILVKKIAELTELNKEKMNDIKTENNENIENVEEIKQGGKHAE